MPTLKRKGFTLIELLVVISIMSPLKNYRFIARQGINLMVK